MITPSRTRLIALEALRHLWRFRSRSALMILIGATGIVGITVTTHYTQAGRLKVLTQLRALGTNILIVAPRRTGGVRAAPGSVVATLVAQDYMAIRREVAEIDLSSAVVSAAFPVKAGDLTKNNCAIEGVEASFAHIKNWPMQSGAFFSDTESRGAARVAVLGATVARDLFGDANPVGARLFINRVPFQVVGVLAERGQDLDAGSEDNQVYVPLNTARRRLLNVDYFSSLVLSARDWNQLDAAAERVRTILLRRHHPRGNAQEDFSVSNQKALIDAQVQASRDLERFATGVAWGVLTIAGLGLLALGWMNVTSRVVEIGTRRALGAAGSDIFLQFLLERLAISVLANVSGVLASLAGLRVAAVSGLMPYAFDWRKILVLCALATSLNAACGLLPARRAAQLDPIRALRW